MHVRQHRHLYSNFECQHNGHGQLCRDRHTDGDSYIVFLKHYNRAGTDGDGGRQRRKRQSNTHRHGNFDQRELQHRRGDTERGRRNLYCCRRNTAGRHRYADRDLYAGCNELLHLHRRFGNCFGHGSKEYSDGNGHAVSGEHHAGASALGDRCCQWRKRQPDAYRRGYTEQRQLYLRDDDAERRHCGNHCSSRCASNGNGYADRNLYAGCARFIDL